MEENNSVPRAVDMLLGFIRLAFLKIKVLGTVLLGVATASLTQTGHVQAPCLFPESAGERCCWFAAQALGAVDGALGHEHGLGGELGKEEKTGVIAREHPYAPGSEGWTRGRRKGGAA